MGCLGAAFEIALKSSFDPLQFSTAFPHLFPHIGREEHFRTIAPVTTG